MNTIFTYEPLFKLMEELDITFDDFVKKKVIASSTAEKIQNNQDVMISSISKICIALGCDFNDIVSIDDQYDPKVDDEDGSRNGKPWSYEENERLIDEYNNGYSVEEIAKNLQRSAGAISSRLSKLRFAGKIE